MNDNVPRMLACGVLQSTVPTYEMVKCSLLIGLVYCYLVTRSRFYLVLKIIPDPFTFRDAPWIIFLEMLEL